MDTPFADMAEPILRADNVLSDENKAELFDIFHDSKDSAELAQKLQPLAVPDDTKRNLYLAKQQSESTDPVGKVTKVIKSMADIDPQILDLAETHPNVLKTLAAAAGPVKGATAASGEGAAPAAGKPSTDAASPAPLAQPPRPDGLPHLPPIPDKHRRVLASDGGIHDIPEENLDKARGLDPLLHVLNP